MRQVVCHLCGIFPCNAAKAEIIAAHVSGFDIFLDRQIVDTVGPEFFRDLIWPEVGAYQFAVCGHIYAVKTRANDPGKGYEKMSYFIFPWFKKINKNKIKVKVLFNHNTENRNKIIKEVKKIDYKTLPKNFTTPTQFFIYGDKTGILIWSEKPVCILIENIEITQGFLNYFDLMWNISN